jgi:hypothetical protein
MSLLLYKLCSQRRKIVCTSFLLKLKCYFAPDVPKGYNLARYNRKRSLEQTEMSHSLEQRLEDVIEMLTTYDRSEIKRQNRNFQAKKGRKENPGH